MAFVFVPECRQYLKKITGSRSGPPVKKNFIPGFKVPVGAKLILQSESETWVN